MPANLKQKQLQLETASGDDEPSISGESLTRAFNWALGRSRAQQRRTLLQFAEEEIVLPEGRFQGMSWRAHRQPSIAALIPFIDSGLWNRIVVTGCVQSGKSLLGFVMPCLYYLFEYAEPVILAAPTMDVCRDKWVKELRPAIVATRYADLLPTAGRGARGGFSETLEFRNGSILKFMSAGGGDEKRSSFTSRILIATEVDKMDESGRMSREAAPIRQLEARTESYDFWERRIFLECTVSIEEGAIWQELQNGTNSRIACPCPHCGQWVTPERKHLKGWQDLDNELDAMDGTYFETPCCQKKIDDIQRAKMNDDARILHEGQTLGKRGRLIGKPKRTATFSARWNGFNNMFWSSSKLGRDEWFARRAEDEDGAERYQSQFIWTTPYEPTWQEIVRVQPLKLVKRQRDWPRGLVPKDTRQLCMGIDVGKFKLHWTLLAGLGDRSGHIVDYGVEDCPAKELGTEPAIEYALAELQKRIELGWTAEGSESVQTPQLTLIDSGHWAKLIYRISDTFGQGYLPSKGYGIGSRSQNFKPVTRRGNVKHSVGWYYHFTRMELDGVHVLEFDANHWKTRLHQSLILPGAEESREGTFTLYPGTESEHLRFAQHIAAEEHYTTIHEKYGEITVWENPNKRQNHWLDSTVLALVALHVAGYRFKDEPVPQQPNEPIQTPMLVGGEPFLITER